MRDLQALASGLTQPAIHVTTEHNGGRSHFGGNPGLPDGVAWPEHEGRRLEFLARISLPEIQQTLAMDWLPREGALLFFYDMEEQPWGYEASDRGSWAVLQVPDADAEPEPGSPVPFRPIGYRRIESYPSLEREAMVDLSLHYDEPDAYIELAQAAFDGSSSHQIAGYPNPMQGDDMELIAQSAVSDSMRNQPSAEARKAAIRSAAKDWRLLFQVDSDEDLGFSWGGDWGLLYFWVHAERAREGDFRDVWLVLQCT